MPESVGGVPLHPLMVHGAVVFIVLSAIASIAWALIPKLRPYRWWVLGLAGVALLSTLLAASAGETLEELVKETSLVEEHVELAEVLETFVWVLAASTFVAVAVDVWGERLGGARRAIAILATIGILVGGVGAVVMDVSAGHAGAKAVWDDVANAG